MKYKRYFYGGWLATFLFLNHWVVAQTMTVNFSETQGRGVAPERMQIDHIRVEVTIADPLIVDQLQLVTLFYDLQFKACQIDNRLHLIPLLSEQEPICEVNVDFAESELVGRSIGEVQVNRKVGEQRISSFFQFDPVTLHLVENTLPIDACAKLQIQVLHQITNRPVPFAQVTVGQVTQRTNEDGFLEMVSLPPQHTFISSNQEGFDLAFQEMDLFCGQDHKSTLFLSPPREVRVLLDWSHQSLDLDAHLTGPAPGALATYFNEADRFHLYFGNKNVECVDAYCMGRLFVDEVLETKVEPLIFSPPPGAVSLRPGTYRFTAHHFAGSGSISNSGAQVHLWIGNRPEIIFTPPPLEQASGELSNDRMDIWRAFKLEVREDGSVLIDRPQKDYARGVNPSEVR